MLSSKRSSVGGCKTSETSALCDRYDVIITALLAATQSLFGPRVVKLLKLLQSGISYYSMYIASTMTIIVIAGTVYYLYFHSDTDNEEVMILQDMDISYDFQDPVSLELYNNPGVVECGHTLDHASYLSLVKNHMYLVFIYMAVSHRRLIYIYLRSCPLCRHNLGNWIPNHQLRSMMMRFTK